MGLDTIYPAQQLGIERGFVATRLVPAIEVLEFHDTLDGMRATELALRYVEYALGYSCTAYDSIQGLQN